MEIENQEMNKIEDLTPQNLEISSNDNNIDTHKESLINHLNNETNDLTQKNKVKKNKDVDGFKIFDKPTVKLNKILEECITNGFKLILTKDGYYVSGFYGINKEIGQEGYIFAQNTSEEDLMVFYDHKNHKHFIKNFSELVILNSLVWSFYYKNNENYKKPDINWFPYLLEHNALNIIPAIK